MYMKVMDQLIRIHSLCFEEKNQNPVSPINRNFLWKNFYGN